MRPAGAAKWNSNETWLTSQRAGHASRRPTRIEVDAESTYIFLTRDSATTARTAEAIRGQLSVLVRAGWRRAQRCALV